MIVLVDGAEVLSTVEFYYNQALWGICLVNEGGIYEWGSITVSDPAEE